MQLTHFYCSLLIEIKPCRQCLTAVGILVVVAASLLPVATHSQTMKSPDITQAPTLYVVPYAHLDSQWRWEMPQTISEYLLKTMRVNFDYMEKYPHYVFNWTVSTATAS